jgi:hypothetical protein
LTIEKKPSPFLEAGMRLVKLEEEDLRGTRFSEPVGV